MVASTKRPSGFTSTASIRAAMSPLEEAQNLLYRSKIVRDQLRNPVTRKPMNRTEWREYIRKINRK